MSKKKEDYDFLDDLFDRHLNDDRFINSSIIDFGRMIQDTINKEAHRNGYDSLSDMIQGEIQTNLQGRKTSQSFSSVRRNKVYSNRFDYFIEMIQEYEYKDRYRGDYREGHQYAIEKYIDLVKRNHNNLCAVEKIVLEEIHYCYNKQRKMKKDEGYYDGLKFAQSILIQSKTIFMEEVANALNEALNEQ